MTTLLNLYLKELEKFYQLQYAFQTLIDKKTMLVPVNEHSFSISPSQSSILQQIKKWPKDEFYLPPAAWVQPRKGIIEFDNEVWEFLFHGAGLSIINPKTGHDVSTEYSREGMLGITKWTALLYFETLPEPESLTHKFIKHHTNLFEQLIFLGHLIKVPPLFGEGFDDQTFIINTSL